MDTAPFTRKCDKRCVTKERVQGNSHDFLSAVKWQLRLALPAAIPAVLPAAAMTDGTALLLALITTFLVAGRSIPQLRGCPRKGEEGLGARGQVSRCNPVLLCLVPRKWKGSKDVPVLSPSQSFPNFLFACPPPSPSCPGQTCSPDLRGRGPGRMMSSASDLRPSW